MAKVPIHDVWRQLSQSIGGLFAGDHFFEPPMIRLDHGPWAMFINCVSANTGELTETLFTVMYVAYRPRQPFSLYLRPRNRRRQIACPDGEPMSLGYEGIDTQFFTCSTDAITARTLLTYGNLLQKFTDQPRTRLRIGSNIWHGVQDPRITGRDVEQFEEIELRQRDVVRDPSTLKGWFDIAEQLLDQMLSLDLIEPDMPDLDAPLREAYRRGGAWTTQWGRVPIPD
jgi:hypothetical protein